jgi:hypothetical protein
MNLDQEKLKINSSIGEKSIFSLVGGKEIYFLGVIETHDREKGSDNFRVAVFGFIKPDKTVVPQIQDLKSCNFSVLLRDAFIGDEDLQSNNCLYKTFEVIRPVEEKEEKVKFIWTGKANAFVVI